MYYIENHNNITQRIIDINIDLMLLCYRVHLS